MRHPLALLCLLSMLGCATAPESRAPEEDAAQQERLLGEALTRAPAGLGRALEGASREQERAVSRGPRWFVGRYNRASCDCPAYELFVRGAWKRYYTSNPGQLPKGDALFLILGETRDSNLRALNDNVYDSLEVSRVLEDELASLPEAMARMAAMPRR